MNNNYKLYKGGWVGNIAPHELKELSLSESEDMLNGGGVFCKMYL